MSAASGNRRPRPVITVVEARPLNEVAFRDTLPKPSAPPDNNVHLRKPPDRPGAPPARPPSWRRSVPPGVSSDNTHPHPVENGSVKPAQAPQPAPRTSLNTRPISMIDRIPGPPKVVRNNNNNNDLTQTGARSGLDNIGFEKSSTENVSVANLISFDDAEPSDTQATSKALYPQLQTPVDNEPVYAVVNKQRKMDVNQNHAAIPDLSVDPPPVPTRSADLENSQPAVQGQEHNQKTARDIGATPTPLAFLNSGSGEPFPVLRKTVYRDEGEQHLEQEQKNIDGLSKSHVKNNIFTQGIPVFPMAPGFSLKKATVESDESHVKQTRPMSMGPPTAVKPKPGLKPKPAIKPKPAVKPKPASSSAPVTPSEPNQPEIGIGAMARTESSYIANRPQSMLKLCTEDSEEDIARQTKDQEASVSNIISAMRAKLEGSQAEGGAVAGKPKPMKATYRPTIIRPQMQNAPAEQDSEEKEFSSDANQSDNPGLSKPAQSGPVRNRPTIIRARGTAPTNLTAGEVSPEADRDHFREALNNRLSSAVSMPNLAAAKTSAGTEAHNWHGMSTAEEAENETNDLLASEHGPQMEKTQPGRPPTAASRHQVLPMPGPGEQPPRYSPPPAYEEMSFGSTQDLSGKPPPRPMAAPRGERRVLEVQRTTRTTVVKTQSRNHHRSMFNIPSVFSEAPRRSSQPPPRPVSGPAPLRPTAGPQAGKSQVRHNTQLEAGPLPSKQTLGLPTAKSPTTRRQGPPPNLPTRPGPGHPLYHYVVDEAHGIAVYDYDGSQSDELCFKSGDVIILVSQVNEEWILGRCMNKEGIFPVGFVDIVKPLKETMHKTAAVQKLHHSPQAQHTDTGSGPRCKARFDYDGGEDDDVAFQSDDIIKLLERIGDEWLKGEVNGKTGMFPASYVEIIEDLPLEKTSEAPSQTGNEVTARYDFNGEATELSFTKGSRIHVTSQVNEQWLFGELAGKKGSFPASFVDRIPTGLPKPKTEVLTESSPQATGPPKPARIQSESDAYCVATFDYAGDSSGDLKFQKGDTIALLEHVNDDWLKGSIDGRVGLFPVGFVDIIKDLDELPPRPGQTPTSPKRNKESTAKVLAKYDFPGETDSDLVFSAGQEIILMNKVDDEWFQGRIGDREGMFPAAFVDVITPL